MTDPQAAAAYFDKVVPIAQRQTDDLANLEPADDVEDDWNAVVDKQKQGNDLLKSIRDKAKAKDPSGQADLAKLRTTAESVLRGGEEGRRRRLRRQLTATSVRGDTET